MSIGKRPFLSISFVGAKCLEYFIENSTQGQFCIARSPTELFHGCRSADKSCISVPGALIENAAIMTQSNCESDSRNHYEGQDGFCNVLDKFFYIPMFKGIFSAEVRNRMQRKVGL